MVSSQFREYYEELLKQQAKWKGVSVEKIKESVPSLGANVDQYIKLIQKYVNMGVTLFPIVFMEPYGLEESMLKFFGENVISAFK